MKRLIILMMLFCIITVGCTKETTNIEVSTPVKKQYYIGRFEDQVSLYRHLGNKLIVQKEQEKGFELFSVDINDPILGYEYTVTPQDNLLYYKQLDSDRNLKVKQLGNGEENNVLQLQGKVTKTIAKKIACSEVALVSTSPSQKYIVYFTVGDILNQYCMQLYNIETEKNLLLIDSVNEAVLNDMQGNLSWSPNEAYLAVANKQLFNVDSGKLISNINAESVFWSTNGEKLAYTKLDKGYGKVISILDVGTTAIDEVFISNQGEYLPGNIVWNDNDTKLAFTTSLIETKEPYKAIYSLDLIDKKAIRIDTILKMDVEQVSKLENMHYNTAGNILGLTIADSWGSDLYVCNTSTNEWKFFLNIEYLHFENNEDYLCNVGNSMCFVQGENIVELDEDMNTKIIHRSENILEDIYISKKGNSMIMVEKSKNQIVLRQLLNFTIAGL